MLADAYSSDPRLQFLRACPDLRDLPGPLLDRLGQAMEYRSYPIRHEFHSRRSPVRGRPLRLLLHGQVVERIADGELRILRPGALFGVEGAAEWIAGQPEGPDHRYRETSTSAYVFSTCETLELAVDRFGELFADPENHHLAARLLDAHEVRTVATAVAEQFGRTPYLFMVPRARLLELVDGARIERAGQDLHLHAKGDAQDRITFEGDVALCSVLAGRFHMVSSNDEAAQFINFGRVLVSPTKLDLSHPPGQLYVPTADTPMRLLTVSKSRVDELRRQHHDFRRALEQMDGGRP